MPAKKNDQKPEGMPEAVPAKVVDTIANAKAFKAKWDKLKAGDPSGSVAIPGARRSVEMRHVEVDKNVISVWTSSDKSLAPDFVLVNAPIEVRAGDGTTVEDPMTAIALAIDGATK